MSNCVQGKALRVLFAHGLESGPRGYKVGLLREEGFSVTCLQMPSKELTSLSNPHLKRAAAAALAAVAGAAGALAGLGLNVAGATAAAAVAAACAAVSVRESRKGGRLAMERCVEVQQRAMAEEGPFDVLVGSSWGGAVAVELVARGLWNGPALLLCPAAHRYARWAGAPDPGLALRARLLDGSGRRVLVVHGTEDRVVRMADSRALVDAVGSPEACSLLAVGGGHRLAEATRDGELGQWVREVAAKSGISD